MGIRRYQQLCISGSIHSRYLKVRSSQEIQLLFSKINMAVYGWDIVGASSCSFKKTF